MRSRALLAAAIAAGAVAALGVIVVVRGDGAAREPVGNLLEPRDPGPVHVHGLGINPADGALFIATHTGLYRIAAGEREARRVGHSRQDTMGFTVAGPNRFLGSGHPDLEAMREGRLPPHLGLIESTDAGRTWRSLSLLGQADFHVLRARGGAVYGFDATNGRLLFTDDGGRTWETRPSPAPLYDLVVDPRERSHVVAATERGVFSSLDGARSWQRLHDLVGLLAWPDRAQLYLVDPAGEVWTSPNGGRRWSRAGMIGGEPAAFLGHTSRELYAALHDGTIKRSVDGGRTWTIRSAP